jgi:hypothetical protein
VLAAPAADVTAADVTAAYFGTPADGAAS